MMRTGSESLTGHVEAPVLEPGGRNGDPRPGRRLIHSTVVILQSVVFFHLRLHVPKISLYE